MEFIQNRSPHPSPTTTEATAGVEVGDFEYKVATQALDTRLTAFSGDGAEHSWRRAVALKMSGWLWHGGNGGQRWLACWPLVCNTGCGREKWGEGSLGKIEKGKRRKRKRKRKKIKRDNQPPPSK